MVPVRGCPVVVVALWEGLPMGLPEIPEGGVPG